ncbi:MAG: hypothetical protein H6509_09145 [Bryobacterales bacterium]|nr:hypothetical protein [Acidobacteriota bacterium]MCB9384769.1 hypothetical protein [Bryobacterales bacterium]
MLRAFLLLLLSIVLLPAQDTACLLEIVAGGGRSFAGDGGAAALAEFDEPEDAVARPDGSIYVADTGNGRVRWISPAGVITTILESPEPARIAVSPEGDLFVFDRTQRRIIRRMSNGFVRTVLAEQGLGAEVGLDVGPGPTLYLADAEHGRLLTLDRTGRVETVNAELVEPTDVALGPDGSLYVADVGTGQIKRIWPDGSVSDFAPIPGGGSGIYFADFLLGVPRPYPIVLQGSSPKVRLAVNAAGEVAVTSATRPVLGLSPAPILDSGFSTGSATQVGSDLAPVVSRISPGGEASPVNGPYPGPDASIDWLPDGRILLGSRSLDQFFALGEDSVEVLAGVGAAGASGDGGPAAQARLRAPQSVAALASGEIFIADEERVRVVRPGGVIEAADVTRPEAYLAADSAGGLYVAGADELLYRSPGGAATTVALAVDCTDCQSAGVLLSSPYAFGRIAKAFDGVWVQERSASGLTVRVTRNGEFVTDLPRISPLASLLTGLFARRLGEDIRSGLMIATLGSIFALDAGRNEWIEIPGTEGFVPGDALHSLRTADDDVYFTQGASVMRLTPEGTLNTVAKLEAPTALALSAEGDLLIADSGAGEVWRLRSPTECDRTARPQIYISGVLNAAATRVDRFLRVAPFAPGMIASVYGVRLGPEAPAAYGPAASSVPTELGGVSATAGGKPVGVAYASQGQLNLVLPFDLPEQGAIDLVVTVDGVASEPYSLTMGAASPGVLAVLNADGSRNSEERPAKAGDEVSLLVSGLGRPGVDIDALAISDDVVPWPVEELSIGFSTLDGDTVEATVLWARSRPGEIASVVEVRFRVPEGVDGSGSLLRGDAWTLFDLYVE